MKQPCQLQEAGFDAETVWDEAMSGAIVSDRAPRESQVLVTLDLDFANIRAYPRGRYAGIIVLRLNRQDKAAIVSPGSLPNFAGKKSGWRVVDRTTESHPFSAQRLIRFVTIPLKSI